MSQLKFEEFQIVNGQNQATGRSYLDVTRPDGTEIGCISRECSDRWTFMVNYDRPLQLEAGELRQVAERLDTLNAGGKEGDPCAG